MKPNLSYDLTTAILTTADAFLRESQRLFRPLGLTGAQFNVLNILANHTPEGGMSQRELGDRLVVDRSNVSGLLDRLEKTGWVKREDHPEDRRVYRVNLTATGRRLWEKVQPLYVDVLRQVTRGLPPRRMRECLETLQQLEASAANWTINGTARKRTTAVPRAAE
ncbi:MAG: MarR family transcriptional regulator [Opitutaceae bacterium]